MEQEHLSPHLGQESSVRIADMLGLMRTFAKSCMWLDTQIRRAVSLIAICAEWKKA